MPPRMPRRTTGRIGRDSSRAAEPQAGSRHQLAGPEPGAHVLLADADRQVERFDAVIGPRRAQHRPRRHPIATADEDITQIRVGGAYAAAVIDRDREVAGHVTGERDPAPSSGPDRSPDLDLEIHSPVPPVRPHRCEVANDRPVDRRDEGTGEDQGKCKDGGHERSCRPYRALTQQGRGTSEGQSPRALGQELRA